MVLDVGDYSFEYEINNGEITILSCSCPVGASVVVFPSFINGVKVTKIGEYATNKNHDVDFSDESNMPQLEEFFGASIVVEEGIEEIGDFAFSQCAVLNKVVLPSTVRRIGKNIFDQSANLETIEICDNNPYYSSFNKCNCVVELKTKTLVAAIKATTIPEGTLVVGTDAYHNLDEIESIIVPDSVVTLEKNCFNNCPNLSSLSIGKSVKIANDCIINCYYLKDIEISDENSFITYNPISRNFVSKTAKVFKKLTQLPLDSFDFSIEYYDNGKPKQYFSLKYLKKNNTLTFDRNWKTTIIRCLDIFKEPLREIAYIMGYVKENVESNGSEYAERGIYRINGNTRLTFRCNNYLVSNLILNNEKHFIRLISILEFLSPIELGLVRNIPEIKYSIDDVDCKYLTIPDVYCDMFDTYKVLNNGNHPLDTDSVVVKTNVFASRKTLTYVKIRKCDYRFEGNQFKNCEKLKAIYLNGCPEAKMYIDDSVKHLIVNDPFSQEPINEVDDESAF